MKKLLLSILFLTTVFVSGQTLNQIPRSGSDAGFIEHLPASYYSNPTKKFPVIIFFHGSGEWGTGLSGGAGLDKLYKTGLPMLIKNGNWSYRDQFIVLMPQKYSTKNTCTTGDDVKNFIEFAKSKYSKKNRIDLSRLYLTGLSCGGNAVDDYLGAHQSDGNVAAAVPISANGMKVWRNTGCNITVPMWGIHGEKDPTSPVANDREAYGNYRNCSQLNGKVKYSEYSGYGHNVWDVTYTGNYNNNGESVKIFDWMLQFKLGSQDDNCGAPESGSASNVTSTTATLNWSATAAANYTIEITPSGGGKYVQTSDFTGTSYNLGGLASGKSYAVDIYSNCSSGRVARSFTFTTSAGNTCGAPSAASASNVTSTTATLNWSATTAAKYTIEITPSGGGKYVQASDFTGTSYNLGGLASGRSYAVDIYSNCSSGRVARSFTFTTSAGNTCGAPASASASNITSTTAKLNWSATVAQNYYIYILPEGGNWYLQTSDFTGTSYTLSGLGVGKNYTVDVYSNCPSGAVATRFSFRTNNTGKMSADNVELSMQNSEIKNDYDNGFIAYPNPINTEVTLDFSVKEEKNVSISIYSITGALVKNLVSNQIYQPGNHLVKWDVNQNNGTPVSRGIYICQLRVGDKLETIKLNVSK